MPRGVERTDDSSQASHRNSRALARRRRPRRLHRRTISRPSPPPRRRRAAPARPSAAPAPGRLRQRLPQGRPVGRPDRDLRGPRLRDRLRREGQHRHERPRRRDGDELHRHDLEGPPAQGDARRQVPGRRSRGDQGAELGRPPRRRRSPTRRSCASARSRWRSATRSGSARA